MMKTKRKLKAQLRNSGGFYLNFGLELAEITLSINNDFTADELAQFREAYAVLCGKYTRLFNGDIEEGKEELDRQIREARNDDSLPPFDKRFRG